MSQSLTIDAVDMTSNNNSLNPRDNEVAECRTSEGADAAPDTSPQQKPYGIGPYRRSGVVIGWRLSIRRRGEMISRFFTAANYGGMDQAFQAAITLREDINSEFRPLTKRERHAVLSSANTSGVPGVTRLADGHWKAFIRYADGRHKTKYFSVRRYGEEEAKRRAICAREELLMDVQGYELRHVETRELQVCEVDLGSQVIVQPHKDHPAVSPFKPPHLNKVKGVGTANIKTLLRGGQIVITTYRVAEFTQSNGLPKRRYFSVTRFGEEEALRLATEQRQAWELETLAAQGNDQEPRRQRTQNTASVLSAC